MQVILRNEIKVPRFTKASGFSPNRLLVKTSAVVKLARIRSLRKVFDVPSRCVRLQRSLDVPKNLVTNRLPAAGEGLIPANPLQYFHRIF